MHDRSATPEFRLDRWETELNTAIPGDLRDTVTPAAMARSLQLLALGDALSPPQPQQLNEWLRGNATGAKRIRAAIPADWQIGDKTGSGDYGTANDIAVFYPPARKLIVLAIYHTQKKSDAKWRSEKSIKSFLGAKIDGSFSHRYNPCRWSCWSCLAHCT